MLGEKIGELSGKVTGTRILPAESAGPKIEVSIQETGKILNVEGIDQGTYTACAHAGGTTCGEGQGIFTTKDGEIATWCGTGVGRPTGRGQGASWRGALYWQTTSQKLSRLNGLCVVFEHECDENGNTQTKLTEWR
jgi:hypothetical protein